MKRPGGAISGAVGEQPGTAKYPELLSPLTVGAHTLRNRVIMGSMHTGMEDGADQIDELAAYYSERAQGGVALIVTGGHAPNGEGVLAQGSSTMTTDTAAEQHRVLTSAVHLHGAKIALQILHAGRYARHPFPAAPSPIKSPISTEVPHEMTAQEVEQTIGDYARAAKLAKDAGYDGVEIMGSEGYLINQFLAHRTNHRNDRWGGDARKRMRFPVEVVERTRAEVGSEMLLIYRISLADLVDGGQSWSEVVELAHRLEDAGVSILSSGFGWHESSVPTIMSSVPRGAFTWITNKLRREVDTPVVACNRINSPDFAERILADGDADLVSMARPLLADPQFVVKAQADQAEHINTCIACNQACLDHGVDGLPVSCLVNPRAGRETVLMLGPVRAAKKIAVVGAGPAGLAAATELAARGHTIDLFEKGQRLGGQFRLAQKVPGKEEFAETLRYFQERIALTGVTLHLGHAPQAVELSEFDEVVIATGVVPRIPAFEGVDHSKVATYADVLDGRVSAGERVAVIGAGGIGFDLCEFLLFEAAISRDAWMERWGVVDPETQRGGLVQRPAIAPKREVVLLQRKHTRLGRTLGRTTGWARRLALVDARVRMESGVTYDKIDDSGLHVTLGSGTDLRHELLEVDTVVLCSGQVSVRDLVAPLKSLAVPVHVIGGAHVAAEVDAKRAILQATELASVL